MTKTTTAKLAAAALAIITGASGCTAVQSVHFAVARYCHAPDEVRAVTREAVALATAPNRVEIHCHE
jgi:hypothetical protein